MATNYEEEADAYYAAKEKYTEVLQKAADELPQEAASLVNRAPAKEKNGYGPWFLSEERNTAALAQLAKDFTNLMKDMKPPDKEPEKPEAKLKSKGKKK